MFALQHWVTATVDLSALGAGTGTFGLLPAAALPTIGAVLGAIFEIDNTGGESAPAGKKRIAAERTETTGAGASKSAAARVKAKAARVADDDDDAGSAAERGSARR